MRGILAIAGCAIVIFISGAAEKAEAAVPIINGLSPNTKEAGAGTFMMTVTGWSFNSGSVVRWNGSNVSTSFISSTQLAATVGSGLIANTGTATVTVFNSGRKGGTSNSKSFTITAPTVTSPPLPPPPPPAPSPLSITTTSLPGGTANASFSSTVAATGGTPAYGWSLVNGGGSLPPGLTLSATGAISGTPTQSGTFNFTTQASDSSSQVAQKVLSIVVAADPNQTTTPPPTTGNILFESGFEDTTAPGRWGYINGPADVIFTSTPPPGRSGKALESHYYVCGATDGTCGAKSQDRNRWISKVISPGVEHFFLRGYLYFKTPERDAPRDAQVQRKLLWFADSISASNNVNGNYQMIISSFMGATSFVPELALIGQYNTAGACPGSQISIYNLGPPLNWDTWHAVEVEMQLNTPGVADGTLRIWVNGRQTYSNAAVNFRSTCRTPISFFGIGEQANRYEYRVMNEYRYWDDIVISTGYIGP